MTDPQPLTDAELEGLKPNADGFTARLVATVEQTRKERDAADACILKMIGGEYLIWDGTSWWWGDNPDYDPDAYMASDETVDAIRRARAGTERTTDA